jgi:hypothetical protein
MDEARRRCSGHRMRLISLPLCLASSVGLALAFACIPASVAQTGNGTNSGSNGGQGSLRGSFPGRVDVGPLSNDDYDPLMMERRMRALNIERQKEMVSDTNKLLRLARELNAEVAARKSDALTPDQLHKIAEIEKLARNVKERMTSAVGGIQSVIPPPAVVYPVR